MKEAGLGDHFDVSRYPHIREQSDKDLLAWAVRRGSGCIWLEESERTYVRGFKHRLITKGPPVRRPLFRLNRPDTEWIEKAISPMQIRSDEAFQTLVSISLYENQ